MKEGEEVNAHELAAMIDGVTCGNEVTVRTKILAAQNGLVIVYGASDDLMEFDGAIEAELSAYGGRVASVTRDGVVVPPDCDPEFRMCPYYEAAIKHCKKIKAVWCPDGTDFAWVYETDIPHEVFRVLEDGEHYCLGIVFSVEDLK